MLAAADREEAEKRERAGPAEPPAVGAFTSSAEGVCLLPIGRSAAGACDGDDDSDDDDSDDDDCDDDDDDLVSTDQREET